MTKCSTMRAAQKLLKLHKEISELFPYVEGAQHSQAVGMAEYALAGDFRKVEAMRKELGLCAGVVTDAIEKAGFRAS